ncbi:hypothetical protein E2C01_085517 [Portunus trituberculatus]|uniref:Uncharacterized protein n=1 Tax=Portunus trituberculatus TaxID=210409 RepID=A0A5B7J938_PORTR|nr:hypothetical protein [Portunus trituberculatus]
MTEEQGTYSMEMMQKKRTREPRCKDNDGNNTQAMQAILFLNAVDQRWESVHLRYRSNKS